MSLSAIIPVSIAFAAASATAAIVLPAVRRIAKAYRDNAEDETAGPQCAAAFPSLTVVAYDYARISDIEGYLQSLAAQDYPNFSVVFVSNASAAEARELEEAYATRYPDFHFTFIPPGSHNLSRRKLALTVGIKAAKGEYVLTTLSNCRIPSERWLSLMMEPITSGSGKDICLGISRPDFAQLRGAGKWYRQFDFTVRTAQWLAAATDGRTVRGDGFNLIFRRDLFFDAKGYSQTIYYNPGDDDLFLTQIADSYSGNTAVQLNPDAVLVQDWEGQADKFAKEQKERYDFTRPLLPKQPFLKAAAVSWMQWTVLFSSAAAIATAVISTGISLPALCLLLAALIVSLLFWGMEIALYRRISRMLCSKRLWWAVMPFLLWRPIGNLAFRLRHRSRRDRHFTWRN